MPTPSPSLPNEPASEPPHAAFSMLAEGMQRQLYRTGWKSLRPIQADAIKAFFQTNQHLLIMAETAGGKTEAAFLPLLSAISQEPTGSVRALYVGPLKALINDQFGRLEELCTYLDVPVHRWHGDVGDNQKTALVRESGGVLLITPESLESLLINRTAHLAALFGGLRAVVIDEVHAFLEDERGLHLSSLLSRIRRYQSPQQPPFRMIGLSATVGDVVAAQRYLSPDAPEEVTIVTDNAGGKELLMKIHGYLLQPAQASTDDDREDGNENDDRMRVMNAIATDLVEHCRSHSNLVFANSKGDIEIYADMANEISASAGLPESFLVHHGSLARELREDTEYVMKGGKPMTTICSSTLEMGIDIGAVRTVGQIGSTWSVASLKQRIGRSGRKDGEPRRMRGYVICDLGGPAVPAGVAGDPLSQIPLELLQTTAVCELMLRKWIEPPSPAQLDLSTLTQQIISTIAETGAIFPLDLHSRLCTSGPFRSITPSLFAQLLRQLGAGDVIEQGPDGRLILGLKGEQLRRQRDFYAAFASQVEFAIIAGDRTLGTMPIDSRPKTGEHLVFAGRRWQVTDVDEERYKIHVLPTKRQGRPRFMGSPGEVHAQIREEMMAVLASDAIPIYLDKVAAQALTAARSVSRAHDLARRSIRPLGADRSQWLTWTGTRAQRTLIAVLETLGIETTDHVIAIECRTSAVNLATRLHDASSLLEQPGTLAAAVPLKQYRKYDALISDDLLNQSIATDRLDCVAAEKVLRESDAL